MDDPGPPHVGDLALVEVAALGHHTKIQTAANEPLRLYLGDTLLGVFGNRYTTDAFEAEVCALDPLHLLTAAGMVGTVRSRHRDTKSPTRLAFLGYLADAAGQRLNLKALHFRPTVPRDASHNVVLLVGTGMNSGKTTTAAILVKALLRYHLRVAACKLTGSVSHRDPFEYYATGAHDVRDFSDYGFPSTYLCPQEELRRLFQTMLTDTAGARPDVVMEIADGVLQRETQLVLADAEIRRRTRGVVLTAPCAASALHGLAQLNDYGHTVLAVSGLITNAPLFVVYGHFLVPRNASIKTRNPENPHWRVHPVVFSATLLDVCRDRPDASGAV